MSTNGSTIINGVLMRVNKVGIIITGRSGIGKSELALSLLYHGQQLVADDAIVVEKKHNQLVGHCPYHLNHFLNVYGLGFVNVKKIFGVSAIIKKQPIMLIIELLEKVDNGDRLTGCYGNKTLLTVDLPCLQLARDTRRDLVTLVEIATQNHILQSKGYNSHKDFIDRQQQLLVDHSSR